MKSVAISACLLGEKCKYSGESNYDSELVELLNAQNIELIPFCPEDYAFGTPRPTMDLVEIDGSIEAISNSTGENLTTPIKAYAQNFLDKYNDIECLIGKSKSPSCGVGSAKLYDKQKNLISNQYSGIMAQEAQKRHIKTIDSNEAIKEYHEICN